MPTTKKLSLISALPLKNASLSFVPEMSVNRIKHFFLLSIEVSAPDEVDSCPYKTSEKVVELFGRCYYT